MKTAFRIGLVVLAALLAVATGWSAQENPRDDAAARRNRHGGGGTLDQEYNQLRYSRTNDYGATWTTAQAGDLSTFAPYDNESFGDFSAVTTTAGELCYLITLLNAETPGVYAMVGPSFTPVLVMAQGDNDLSYGYSPGGHTDIGRAPDGSLVGVIWGGNASGMTTVWACKSTNNGSSWTSWVIAVEPNIPHFDASENDGYYKMPDRIHAQWAWALFQAPSEDGFDMKIIRFNHTTTGTGTVVPLGNYAGHAFSFMFGGTKPFAYDPINNYLFASFRNNDASGVLIYYSDDAGATWQHGGEVIDGAHRYPSMSTKVATETPYLVYNQSVGVLEPGQEQCLRMTYDEFGYGGGSWVDPPVNFQCITLFDETTAGYNSIYVPEVWWWDSNRGVCGFTGYTNFLQGEIIYTNRTTDGGATWIDMGTRAHYLDDQIIAATMQIPELVGGENGVAYMIFSGAPGITDEVAPTVTQMELLTPATDPDGPYVVRAYYSDNVGIDISNPGGAGPWINWGSTSGETVAYVNQDSAHYDNAETHVGWYYFTIPDTALGGISLGDSVFFYCDGYDVAGIYAASDEQYLVAGVIWQDVENEPPVPNSITLHGNYPNPFNPGTEIRFDLAVESSPTLVVYNSLGQEVRTLLSGRESLSAGSHNVYFDAAGLTSGVYLYTLSAGNFSETRKMVLVK